MLTIKRYPNRKFYDTEEKRYITLDDISDRIRAGREVQVIDQGSGEEITSVVLTQIIFEQEKKQSGFVPRSVLTGLVQAGGYTMGRMRSALSNPAAPKPGLDEDQFQRLLDERGVPTRTELETLTEQLEILMDKLEGIDDHPDGEK